MGYRTLSLRGDFLVEVSSPSPHPRAPAHRKLRIRIRDLLPEILSPICSDPPAPPRHTHRIAYQRPAARVDGRSPPRLFRPAAPARGPGPARDGRLGILRTHPHLHPPRGPPRTDPPHVRFSGEAIRPPPAGRLAHRARVGATIAHDSLRRRRRIHAGGRRPFSRRRVRAC